MTITREQADAIAKASFEKLMGRPHPWEGAQDWVIAAIIEASQPIADVQAGGIAWISVADRLPADGQECATFSEKSYHQHGTDRWLAVRQCWEREWDRVGKGGGKGTRWVTHWIPLPADPTVAHRQQRLYANSP